MTQGRVDLAVSASDVLERAARRQETPVVSSLVELTEAARDAGIESRHVVAAVAELLAERSRPMPVSVWRRVFGLMSFGVGAGAVMFWQSIQGSPGAVLIHMAAIALMWIGLRLDRPEQWKGEERR
jgi:hypothetical protein